MRRAMRIGAILVIVALIAGGAGFFLWRQNGAASAEAALETLPVTRGDIEETVSATGNVAATQEATLAFASSGAIEDVMAEEGQRVQAGDILARLDTSSLEWQITRAQASLGTAQTRLEQAQQPPTQDELASAQAALNNARTNLEKVKEGASAEDLASAQAGLDSARSNLAQVREGPTQEEIAASQAALDTAQAAVRQAQAAYDRVKHRPDLAMLQESLNLENATTELERARANYDALLSRPTVSEVAAAEAQVAQAQAQLAALEERPTDAEVAAAEAQVAQAESQLVALRERPKSEDVAVFEAQVEEAAVALAQAEAQLSDAIVEAPFDGTVLAVDAREGEWATPGMPAFVLAATEPLVLEVNLDEADVAQVEVGQQAHISFDALRDLETDTVDGVVSYIAPSSTNVGGAVAYPVELSFSAGSLPVRLGMTADVDIVTAGADGVLLVPNQAIEADRVAGRYYVRIPAAPGEGTASPEEGTERVEVRIGLRDESQTQVVEGLAEGDLVVLPRVPEQGEPDNRFGPPENRRGGPFGEQ